MINQSDFPFRLLTRKYNATLTFTQMLHPQRLSFDRDYLEFHLRDLDFTRKVDLASPVVVQLCGNDPQTVVEAGRKVQAFCDGIGEHASIRTPQTLTNLPPRLESRLSPRSCAEGAHRRLPPREEGLAHNRERR